MAAAGRAGERVHCTGDECPRIGAKWERRVAEVTPPKSGVAAVWTVPGFGSSKGSGGANAPIHFGDAPAATEKSVSERKPPAKIATKTGAKKPLKAAAASASRKARR